MADNLFDGIVNTVRGWISGTESNVPIRPQYSQYTPLTEAEKDGGVVAIDSITGAKIYTPDTSKLKNGVYKYGKYSPADNSIVVNKNFIHGSVYDHERIHAAQSYLNKSTIDDRDWAGLQSKLGASHNKHVSEYSHPPFDERPAILFATDTNISPEDKYIYYRNYMNRIKKESKAGSYVMENSVPTWMNARYTKDNPPEHYPLSDVIRKLSLSVR